MEKELVDVQISSETKFEIDFVDGDLVLKVSYDGKGVGSALSVNVEPEYFLDKLAEAIPGKLDDSMIEMLKLALKK